MVKRQRREKGNSMCQFEDGFTSIPDQEFTSGPCTESRGRPRFFRSYFLLEIEAPVARGIRVYVIKRFTETEFTKTNSFAEERGGEDGATAAAR